MENEAIVAVEDAQKGYENFYQGHQCLHQGQDQGDKRFEEQAGQGCIDWIPVATINVYTDVYTDVNYDLVISCECLVRGV